MKFKFDPIVLLLILLIGTGTFVYAKNFIFNKTTNTQTESALDATIFKAEVLANANSSSTKPYIDLAKLYLQKVRETFDASYYTKVDVLMDKALAVNVKDPDISAILASTAMGRHDFKTGLEHITKALALNKTTAAYYGLQADAQIEVGKYQEAVDSIQKMTDLRPGFASWSRIAYIRELYGDVPGAKYALNQAIQSGSNYSENIAWAYVELGKLDMRGNLPLATEDFNAALRIQPTYSQAHEGLGKVAFAKRDSKSAKNSFLSAYQTLPLAQYATDLGNVYAYENNQTKASQQYALAQVALSTSKKSGVNTDLEESLFLSDHDLDLEHALEMATRAHIDRPNIYSADYLSWALYKNGKSAEAAKYTKEALQLGEFDTLILFHQGMIALANKDKTQAKKYLSKAYDLNPNFSIQYADLLKTTLDSLN